MVSSQIPVEEVLDQSQALHMMDRVTAYLPAFLVVVPLLLNLTLIAVVTPPDHQIPSYSLSR